MEAVAARRRIFPAKSAGLTERLISACTEVRICLLARASQMSKHAFGGAMR
jgi:hypothetical protein